MDNLVKNVILTPFNILYKISPELDLKLLFRLKQGYKLDLKAPKTYSEKIQWIKLYDHNPSMPICCDKYTVRQFVENECCGKILNRLIWDGFKPEEIPFDDLPEKFVIKVTHGSSFNIVCKNKAMLDREDVIRKCNKWLNAKFLSCYGEWFYGKEKPRVIVEEYIESTDDEQLRDYKVYCFNGEPKIVEVHVDRFTKHRAAIYDCDWNLLEGKHTGTGCTDRAIERPECLEEMLEYSRVLSRKFHHARVDFYISDNKLIFGEITFTPGAGFDRFSSYDFDLMLGNYLNLNN